MKKIIGIFFCTLLIGTIIPVGINATDTHNPLDGGWLEEHDGIKILHISGSSYEMGYQYGFLLKEEILENSRAVISFLEQVGFFYSDLLDVWNVMKDYVPLEIIKEMNGMANGSEISFEQISAINMLGPIYHDITCCGSAAWGPATSDGNLYHMRSYDASLNIRDPISGKYLQENQILIVRKPNNGYASLYPSIACDIGIVGGINENSIGIGYKLSWSPEDKTFHGTPKEFRMKMILDHASTVEEAIDIINANKTKGANFIISDGKIPIGFVVEQSANLSYVGTWNNTVESNRPFWRIDHVVRRTNCFVDHTLASVQRHHYSPRSFLLWLLWKVDFLEENNLFPHWKHYWVLSKDIEKHWGDLNLNNTMSILRTVYSGKTDISWAILTKIFEFFRPMHQWVACPETGDIVISFASADRAAHENPAYYFNMYELLNSEPPP